jgi:integrase
LGLKRSDISCENGTAYYTYRGKGGKRAKRELPRPAFEAIERALAAWGKSLVAMDPAESLWPSGSPGANGRGLTSGTFYGNLRRYMRNAGLPPAGVHILRHSAAKLRRDAGESVEEVSQFLDHSSLAVTTVYLRRLEGQEDRSWGRVAEAIGI